MPDRSRSLQLAESHDRFARLDVTAYDVRLDLSADVETFASTTTIHFLSTGGPTFLDVEPRRLIEARLNGQRVDPDLLDRGRLPLETAAGENELVVAAVMRFRNDGEGLHRSVDPADGAHYVYGMSFMDAAPSIFACFDQPDLKAPYTLHVTAPRGWIVVGNAPGVQVEPGLWEFEETRPLSTYFVTLVAGPYHLITDEHDGIPLGLSARKSLASALEGDADELLTVTRQCFDEFHRLFEIRYPFGGYHQAFVPEFNAGAMENPGCVTFRDPLVFSSRVTRGERVQRASTIAHEMAHQWFGNLVTPKWWDDLWLNESFAEYTGNRVTADVTEFGDVWVHNAHAQRQWGLAADQRPSTHPVAGTGATDAVAALQDFDGISYAKGSSVLKQLNATLGDEVFFGGVREHFARHRFGNATMHDLFDAWGSAGGPDLAEWTTGWLRTAGLDTITLDRATGEVVRRVPTAHPADRRHTLRVGVAAGAGDWAVSTVTLTGERTPLPAPVVDGAAVVLDPFEETWALVQPDQVTVTALPALLARTDDAMLRAGIWNGVRSAFHNAALDPEVALGLVEAGIPHETQDDGVGAVTAWALSSVMAVVEEPGRALPRIHRAARARLETAQPGSTLQLAALQAAIASNDDLDELRGWLDGTGVPDRVSVDLEVRWQILNRLADLGEVDRTELSRRRDDEPTARSRVEHARATAALPDAGAKAWAWRRFLGQDDVPNYELEATGLGMWRRGQEDLTAPYAERYFAELPDTTKVRSGWLLADAGHSFFPVTAVDRATVALGHETIAAPGLESSLRRMLVDCTDDLERRLAVRRAYDGGPTA